MVIIKEDNIPPMKWPLGRVIKTYPGNDGFIRDVDVKTSTRVFNRPIRRLAVLPVEDSAKPSQEKAVTSISSAQNNNPETTRMTLSSNTLLLTILAMLLIFPIALANPIDDKKFGSKLGIHFEEIGSTSISTSQWKLIVYYDLSTYWTDTAFLLNGTSSEYIRVC